MEPVIVVHGGAGTHAAIELGHVTRKDMQDGVKAAASAGYRKLCDGGSAVDAVEAAVMYMEKDPAFNAGCGSFLTQAGCVEMDASIMEGRGRRAAGVACVSNVMYPVQVARLVMEKTDHVLMVSEGAQKFAETNGVPRVETTDLVTAKALDHLQTFTEFNPSVRVEFPDTGGIRSVGDASHDTVGAVARDASGNVAAASSTGGINAKLPGRVGDSAIIGCGCYADNYVGAVTCTGHGEAFIKAAFSRTVCDLLRQGMPCQQALETCLEDTCAQVQGMGGAICVDAAGHSGLSFNTAGMAWCRIHEDEITSGIYPGEELKETLHL